MRRAWGVSIVILICGWGRAEPELPKISDVTAPIDGLSHRQAHITWHTDQPASSQVFYGIQPPSPNYEFQTEVTDPQGVTDHSVLVRGLRKATSYHFRVKSCNRQNLCQASADRQFQTLHLGDINGDGKVNAQDIQMCANVVPLLETRPWAIERCHVVERDDAHWNDEVTSRDVDRVATEILQAPSHTQEEQMIKNMPFEPGVTHIGGIYRFNPQINYLQEGFEKLKEWGSEAIVVSLGGPAYYKDRRPEPHDWPSQDLYSLASLVDRAKMKPYQDLFNAPFNLYTLWTFSSSGYDESPMEDADHPGDFPVGWQKLVEDDFYGLTKHLLQTYNHTGKIFVLKPWEQDWVGLGGDDASRSLSQANADRLVEIMQARQRGVARARRETNFQNVMVYNALEVNRVLDVDRGLNRVINLVAPRASTDLVTYSSWDSTWSQSVDDLNRDFKRALQIINQYAPDPLNLGPARIIVSEYSITGQSADEKRSRIRTVLDILKNFGSKAGFYWNLMECDWPEDNPNNPFEPDDPNRKLLDDCEPETGLVDPHGNPVMPQVEVLKQYWKQGNN